MRKFIGLTAALLFASAAQAQFNTGSKDASDPSYADCNPPASFAKKFPTLTLDKAIKKVNRAIIYESPSLIQSRNPVTGASVSSDDFYANSNLGFKSYGNDHTYAFIGQGLGGPRNFDMRVSNTTYSHGSKVFAETDYSEIFVNIGGRIVPVSLSGESELGFCNSGQGNPCFSTATAMFAIDEALFEEMANADPKKPILATAMRKSGVMASCPLYFSPISFKATLASFDDAYAKAEKKRAEQKAKGF